MEHTSGLPHLPDGQIREALFRDPSEELDELTNEPLLVQHTSTTGPQQPTAPFSASPWGGYISQHSAIQPSSPLAAHPKPNSHPMHSTPGTNGHVERYGYHVPEVSPAVQFEEMRKELFKDSVPKRVTEAVKSVTTSSSLVRRRQRRAGPGSRGHLMPSKPSGEATIQDIIRLARFEGNPIHSSSPGVEGGESHSEIGDSEVDVDMSGVESGEPVSEGQATHWRFILQKLAKGKVTPTAENLLEFHRTMQQVENQKADISRDVFKASHLGLCIKVISALDRDTLPSHDATYGLIRRAERLKNFWLKKFIHEAGDGRHDE
ncbi:hypothetical protein BOTBODRAFT_39140 [Botryobasidium botryosum FD-172 SS1]|uniref:Uncharacterized protein n=1 Tax=Botryobasidium botryosum (strain FD-172 SS1) TaxID=930990 RepID=A0A067M5Z2_BOTB1|nr:hypothetical protein BOTBODRAFT_39140 [Botryobasidium botryosum FD-172 SS1]